MVPLNNVHKNYSVFFHSALVVSQFLAKRQTSKVPSPKFSACSSEETDKLLASDGNDVSYSSVVVWTELNWIYIAMIVIMYYIIRVRRIFNWIIKCKCKSVIRSNLLFWLLFVLKKFQILHLYTSTEPISAMRNHYPVRLKYVHCNTSCKG